MEYDSNRPIKIVDSVFSQPKNTVERNSKLRAEKIVTRKNCFRAEFRLFLTASNIEAEDLDPFANGGIG